MSRVETRTVMTAKLEFSVPLPCDAKDYCELVNFMDSRLVGIYGANSSSATYDDRFTVTSDGETLTLSADLPEQGHVTESSIDLEWPLTHLGKLSELELQEIERLTEGYLAVRNIHKGSKL